VRNLKPHILSLIALVIFIFLAVGSQDTNRSGSSDQTSSSTASPKSQSSPPEAPRQARQLSPEERARVSYAKLYQAAYKKLGRPISVQATGERYDVMELSSALITEGSHTLDAARSDTVECSECMQIIKKLGFKTLTIRGTNFDESWDVAHSHF
jgi:hypothetical protein